MKHEREVLVFARSSMPAEWLPQEGALRLAWEDVRSLLAGGDVVWRWLLRRKAEADAGWKQPIPYVLLQDASGCIAAYQRRGTEKRLHGMWSIGIGGHVEREDEAGGVADTLLACAARELAEEAPGCKAELRFCGVINEEVTEVGTVHWGLVFAAEVEGRPQGGEELVGLHWLPPEQAARLNLELWSRLALRLLVSATS